jgi:DNA-binding CsgD family transcriptional regulator
MRLQPDQALDTLNRLVHLSCGGRPLDRYLNALVIDCLDAFDARAALLFGLEEDLAINIVDSFGITPTQLDEIGPLHLLRESPYSRCLSASAGHHLAAGDAAEPSVVGAAHIAFLPITMRGAPYAGLAIWTGLDPHLDEQSYFWEAISLATGLALTCHWIPEATTAKSAVDTLAVSLTGRQLDILFLVAQGLTNRDIARRLNYGQSTVGHELMAIFKALGVESREAAAREAGKRGLLTTPRGLEGDRPHMAS